MLGFDLTEEQRALQETARKFVKDRIIPVAAECDRESKFPKDVFKAAWELGLVAPNIPAEYGGSGCSELEHTIITEELAYGCSGIQTSMTANALAATPIILGGSEAQKKKYLGMLTSQPVYASYATTEPGAGSDVAALQTRAKKVGDAWELTGQKCFITNGSWASFYVIFATVDPALKHKGIAAFIVDRDAAGVSVGKKEDKMGQRASDTATIVLEEVKVPAENLLAKEGEGFKLAMQTFDRTRPDIGASATGLASAMPPTCSGATPISGAWACTAAGSLVPAISFELGRIAYFLLNQVCCICFVHTYPLSGNCASANSLETLHFLMLPAAAVLWNDP